jgi:LAS superfamily LD-carboxypeptidase LdcB
MKLLKITLTIVLITTLGIQKIACQNIISNEELLGKGTPQFFGTDYKLRKEAHDAFIKLRAAASKAGIKIQVVSSFRSYNHQKRIWERKFKKNETRGLSEEKNIQKIIEYPTIPGTSRHHWGTDIDIIQANTKQPKSLLNASNFHNDGPFCELKEWMDNNAKRFGFYLVYTDNHYRKGFKYEPWHYSYKPLSKAYLKQYKKLKLETILKHDLLGSQSFSETFIQHYLSKNILDINPELL